MKLEIPLNAGFIPEKFSKQATQENTIENKPVVSPPITLSDVPAGTKSLALVLLDHDAIPVSGFTWIHWVTLITDPSLSILPENSSQLDPDYLIQGKNSNAGGMVKMSDNLVTVRYTGPQPPDADHVYQFELYALDNLPDLKAGFWLNELYQKMAGHVLATSTFKFKGRK